MCLKLFFSILYDQMNQSTRLALCLWMSVCFLQQVLGQGNPTSAYNKARAARPDVPQHAGVQAVDPKAAGAQQQNGRFSLLPGAGQEQQGQPQYPQAIPKPNSIPTSGPVPEPTSGQTVGNTGPADGLRVYLHSLAPTSYQPRTAALNPTGQRHVADYSINAGLSPTQRNVMPRNPQQPQRNMNGFGNAVRQPQNTGYADPRQGSLPSNQRFYATSGHQGAQLPGQFFRNSQPPSSPYGSPFFLNALFSNPQAPASLYRPGQMGATMGN